MDDPFVHGIDDRLLVVIGPCSVHDPKAALDYAHPLADQRMQHDDALAIAMPSHFDARAIAVPCPESEADRQAE